MAFPKLPVETLLRERPLHNLLDSGVKLSGDGDNRWELGFAWESDCSDAVRTYDPICADPTNPAKLKNFTVTAPDTDSFVPFQVYLPYICNGVPITESDRDIASRRVLAGGPKAAESYFWTKAMTGATVVGTGTPLEAAALLGQQLANCGTGGTGMIHFPAGAGELYASQRNLKMDDEFRTAGRGDTIVIGSGYSNLGPNGLAAPAGYQWVLATSMVGILESEVEMLESPDNVRINNQPVYLAEQFIGLQYDDCCRFAALVDISQ